MNTWVLIIVFGWIGGISGTVNSTSSLAIDGFTKDSCYAAQQKIQVDGKVVAKTYCVEQ